MRSARVRRNAGARTRECAASDGARRNANACSHDRATGARSRLGLVVVHRSIASTRTRHAGGSARAVSSVVVPSGSVGWSSISIRRLATRRGSVGDRRSWKVIEVWVVAAIRVRRQFTWGGLVVDLGLPTDLPVAVCRRFAFGDIFPGCRIVGDRRLSTSLADSRGVVDRRDSREFGEIRSPTAH